MHPVFCLSSVYIQLSTLTASTDNFVLRRQIELTIGRMTQGAMISVFIKRRRNSNKSQIDKIIIAAIAEMKSHKNSAKNSFF